MEYISLAIGIIGGTIGVISFFANRKREAIDDVKDLDKSHNNNYTEILLLNERLDAVKDDVKEMKQDMREIKNIFITYKEDMRDVAKEVVTDIVKSEIQHHIDIYHQKEK